MKRSKYLTEKVTELSEKKEHLFGQIQAHHLWSGDGISFKCPHCGKKIEIEIKQSEADPDNVEIYWGKSPKEIENKRKRVEKEFEEET